MVAYEVAGLKCVLYLSLSIAEREMLILGRWSKCRNCYLFKQYKVYSFDTANTSFFLNYTCLDFPKF